MGKAANETANDLAVTHLLDGCLVTLMTLSEAVLLEIAVFARVLTTFMSKSLLLMQERISRGAARSH
jgi:hypothetical protein